MFKAKPSSEKNSSIMFFTISTVRRHTEPTLLQTELEAVR